MPSADPDSHQALSHLIGAIYDCALDPSLWPQTLDGMRHALNCQEAAIRLSDLSSGGFLIYNSVGTEAGWDKEHAKHLVEAHGYISNVLSTPGSFDIPHVVSRHVSKEFIQSRYVQNFMLPQGFVDKMIWLLTKTPTRFGRVVVSRNRQQGAFADGEIEFGTLLLPHLRRAITISNLLDARTIERDRLTETFNALRCAVLLTDARGGILRANQTAEQMLRHGNLVQARDNTLVATDDLPASELSLALRAAASNESAIGKSGLAIRLSPLDTAPIFAHILPLTGSDMRARLQPAGVAAVFIAGTPDANAAAETMTSAFNLTASEKRVLLGLLTGQPLTKVAASLDIKDTTAKTHLENIFLKTGVSRQADLVRLGTGLVPPIRDYVSVSAGSGRDTDC